MNKTNLNFHEEAVAQSTINFAGLCLAFLLCTASISLVLGKLVFLYAMLCAFTSVLVFFVTVNVRSYLFSLNNHPKPIATAKIYYFPRLKTV
jgi:hypothetical protein